MINIEFDNLVEGVEYKVWLYKHSDEPHKLLHKVGIFSELNYDNNYAIFKLPDTILSIIVPLHHIKLIEKI